MAASSKIVDLRKLLAERFPTAPLRPGSFWPSGIAALDQLLHGGLPKGSITELSSSSLSAGSASMIAAFLENTCRTRSFLALVDGRDSFDPQSMDSVALRHLLWVRCRKASEALQAADLLLRDGNFPLVILDLVLNPAEELRRIPQTNWYRLQRLVEPAATAFLVLTRHSIIASAQWKLVLANGWHLSHLDRDAAELQAQFQIHVRRRQGLTSSPEELEIARAG